MCFQTGVIHNNKILIEDEGIDLDYLCFLNEHVLTCKNKECIESDHELISDTYYEDMYTECLFGFIKSDKKDECWYWFENLNYGYLPDENAEFSAVQSEVYTQVVKSKYVTFCNKCSPCFPNQFDLSTYGSTLTYTLPLEYFEGAPDLPVIPINQKVNVYYYVDKGKFFLIKDKTKVETQSLYDILDEIEIYTENLNKLLELLKTLEEGRDYTHVVHGECIIITNNIKTDKFI